MCERGAWGRGVVGVVACVAALVASSPAWGQEATLYTLPTASYKGEVSSVVAPKIDSVLKERLSGRPKLKLAPRYGEEGTKTGNAAIQEAKDAYNSGIGLLVTEDFEGAAKKFQRAVQLFEQNLAGVDSFELLADAQLRMGLAFLKAGFDLDAKTALKAYANMVPDAKLSREDYPEELVEQVEKEHRRMEKRGPGVLKVDSTPAGATVELDGKAVGVTPLELKTAPSGSHYLVVRPPGGGGVPFAQKITVQGKGEVDAFAANLTTGTPQVDAGGEEGPVFLVEAKRRAQAGEVDPSMAPYLKELAEQTRSSAVAFVVMRKGKGGRFVAWPFVYEASSDRIALLDRVEFDASLTTVQVDGYKLSEALASAVLAFPAERAITGNPFDEAPAVAVVTPPTGGGVLTPVEPVEPAGGGVVTPLVPIEPVVGEGPPVPEADEDKWYTSWWMWTGVSVLVVGGALAGGALLLDSEAPEQPKGFSTTVRW